MEAPIIGDSSASVIALVMTIRDEVEMLRTNLTYHHALGVDLAFVYDDGSTDGSLESVSDLPYVQARPAVDPSQFSGRPELDRLVSMAATHIQARQMLNTVDAMARARAAGAKWLISLDADELAAVDLVETQAGRLRAALDALPANVEAATFATLEVLQRRLHYTDVMTEETLFKRASVRSQRPVLDPFEGHVRSFPVVYGHKGGKSAIRLSVADALPRSVHRFRGSNGRRLKMRPVGYLLHYYCADAGVFMRKFRTMSEHKDEHVHGNPVVAQKRLWRDVVNRSGMDKAQLEEYFRRWVMFDDKEVERLSRGRSWPVRRRPVLVEVTSAKDLITSMR